jgi:hypothetical protein
LLFIYHTFLKKAEEENNMKRFCCIFKTFFFKDLLLSLTITIITFIFTFSFVNSIGLNTDSTHYDYLYNEKYDDLYLINSSYIYDDNDKQNFYIKDYLDNNHIEYQTIYHFYGLSGTSSQELSFKFNGEIVENATIAIMDYDAANYFPFKMLHGSFFNYEDENQIIVSNDIKKIKTNMEYNLSLRSWISEYPQDLTYLDKIINKVKCIGKIEEEENVFNLNANILFATKDKELLKEIDKNYYKNSEGRATYLLHLNNSHVIDLINLDKIMCKKQYDKSPRIDSSFVYYPTFGYTSDKILPTIKEDFIYKKSFSGLKNDPLFVKNIVYITIISISITFILFFLYTVNSKEKNRKETSIILLSGGTKKEIYIIYLLKLLFSLLSTIILIIVTTYISDYEQYCGLLTIFNIKERLYFKNLLIPILFLILIYLILALIKFISIKKANISIDLRKDN